MLLHIALSFFPHHYLYYLQVRDMGWYGKDLKYISLSQIPSFSVETPGNRDSIPKQFCALNHWKELQAVQFEQCWGNMQFEISMECMLIHAICCSWSTPCAIPLPVTNGARWIHSYIYFWSTELEYSVPSKHTPPFTLNTPRSWILASRLFTLLIVWTTYSLALWESIIFNSA